MFIKIWLKTDEREVFLARKKFFIVANVTPEFRQVLTAFSDIFFLDRRTHRKFWSVDLSFCRSNIIYYFYREKVREESYSFFFFFLRPLSKKRRKARPNKREITDRRAKHRCYSQVIIYVRSSSRLILVNPCQLFSRKRRRRDHREGRTVLPEVN